MSLAPRFNASSLVPDLRLLGWLAEEMASSPLPQHPAMYAVELSDRAVLDTSNWVLSESMPMPTPIVAPREGAYALDTWVQAWAKIQNTL